MTGGECLALTLPEECLVSCQRCLLEMMLTPNQWMVLVTNIAKSKILKQLIVDIHHEVLINITCHSSCTMYVYIIHTVCC